MLEFNYPNFIFIPPQLLALILLRIGKSTKKIPQDMEENRFYQIFDAVEEFIALLSIEGTLLEVNQTALKINSLKPETVIGKALWDCHWWRNSPQFPSLQGQLQKSVQQVAKGELSRYQVQIRNKNQQLITMDFCFKPILNREGKVVYILTEGRDITEFTKTQKQNLNQNQLENNSLLKAVINATDDLTAVLDTDLRYVLFTQAYEQEFLKVFGYQIQIGTKLTDALHHLPQEQAKALNLWQKALQGEEFTIQAEFGDTNRERNYYEIRYYTLKNDEGKIIGALQVGRNITKRQVAINTLKNREWEWSLAENSPDLIIRYDREYRHVYVNPAVEVEIGLPPEAILGKSIKEIGLPLEIVEICNDWLGEAFQGNKIIKELSYDTHSEHKTYQVYLVPEFDQTKTKVQSVLTISRDISKLKEIETGLQKVTQNLLDAQEAANLGNWEYDLLTQQVTWSPQVYRIYDIPVEVGEVTFAEIIERLHPEDREWSLAIVENSLKNGEPYQFDFRIIRPNGEIRWLETRGKKNQQGTKLIGTVIEITERKNNEIVLNKLSEQLEETVRKRTAELQASETRFRNAIENAPFPIAIHAEDGEIVQINQVWTELTGYTHEDIPNIREWTAKAYGENQNSIREVINKLYSFQGRVSDGEFTIKTKDGKELVWDFSSASLGKLDGHRHFVISMANDITESKQVEGQLAASKELFEKFMYYAPVAGYIKNAQGEYVFVNRLVEESWQRPLAEWKEKTDWQLFPPEIAEEIWADDQRVLEEGKPLQFQEVTENQDGIHHWISLKFPIQSSKGETLVAGMSLDISDRVAAQRKIQQHQAELQRLVDANIIGVFFTDYGGHIDKANDAFLQMLGYSRAELEAGAMNWRNLTPPGYEEVDNRIINQLEKTSICPPVEKEYYHKNGRKIPIIIGVALMPGREAEGYCVCYTIDMTASKQAQLKIQDHAKRQTAISKVAKQALLVQGELSDLFQQTAQIIVDTLEIEFCKILRLSNSGKTLNLEAGVGWEPGWVGKATIDIDQESAAAYTLKCQQPLIINDLRQENPFGTSILLETHQVISGMNVIIRDQNKNYGVLGAHTKHQRDFSSEEVNFLISIANILGIAIARHQSETALHSLNQTLETRIKQRTQQLEEINEELKAFTYTISHDLRAPLRAIQGFAMALKEDYEDKLDEIGLDYARRLTESANRLDGLIQDLLAYSHLSRSDLKLKSVDINTVVEEAQKNLATEITKKEAQITVIKPLGSMISNYTILTQIVTNLLHNSLKFVEPSVKPRIKIWSESKNEYLRLYVEDNGIGISQEHHDRIFKIFERLHGVDTYSGTGIGLAIARKGMERLGGQIGVESSTGNGSRFWLEGKQTR